MKSDDCGCGAEGRSRENGREPGACALMWAEAVQRRARSRGFDWTEAEEALAKVREEADEVAAVLGGSEESALVAELGDLLFAVVNVARMAGVDPGAALTGATVRFEARFAEIERLANLRKLPMPGTPLSLLDELWEEAKRSVG